MQKTHGGSKTVSSVGNDGSEVCGRGSEVGSPSDLMNKLQASDGQNSKPLSDLMVQHEGLVLNELRRWNIRPCDTDSVVSNVWLCVWRVSRIPVARPAAWNPSLRTGSVDPFVPLLARIVRTKAIDFHRSCKINRQQQQRLSDTAKVFGDDWKNAATPSASRRRDADASPVNRNPSAPSRRLAELGRGMLEKELAGLPEKQRAVLELHRRGYTNRAIAKMVDCSWGEVSRRLTNAKKAILRRVNVKAAAG